MDYHYWQHVASGDLYAVRVDRGLVVSCVGPLSEAVTSWLRGRAALVAAGCNNSQHVNLRTPDKNPTPHMTHSLINLVESLGDYALHYRREFPDSKVGGDGVLGEYWLQIARGVAGLLNGPIGRLDAGTMDAAIRDMAREEGFSAEEVDTI